jgi:hypothetical protein
MTDDESRAGDRPGKEEASAPRPIGRIVPVLRIELGKVFGAVDAYLCELAKHASAMRAEHRAGFEGMLGSPANQDVAHLVAPEFRNALLQLMRLVDDALLPDGKDDARQVIWLAERLLKDRGRARWVDHCRKAFLACQQPFATDAERDEVIAAQRDALLPALAELDTRAKTLKPEGVARALFEFSRRPSLHLVGGEEDPERRTLAGLAARLARDCDAFDSKGRKRDDVVKAFKYHTREDHSDK